MAFNRACLSGFALLAVLLGYCLSPMRAQAIIVGGFDQARGGAASIPGLVAQGLVTFLGAHAPGYSLTSSNTLTPTYLSSVDVVILGGQFSDNTVIAGLSAAEQTALVNFVRDGGNVGIIIEHEFQGGPGGDAVRESLINPFGLHTMGIISGAAVFFDPAHPIANGPAGAITQYSLNGSGYFDDLGPWALPLATDSLSHLPVSVVIERGAIESGSGRVLMNGDANSLLSSPTLASNSLAYLLPNLGDGNSDDIVDGADYTIWADHFLKSTTKLFEGDFNRDGKVDGADYTIWADNFSPAQLSLTAVPEPSTLALGGVGALALAVTAVRRRWA